MPQPNFVPPSIDRSILRLAFAAIFSFVIYGCSEQASNQPPAPLPHEVGYGQVTTASWYGPGFDGRRTSNGEIYNQRAMTAASRTLPIGSHARVTNLKTGKSVVVRINDRGPFVKGRGIDLSHAAARRIGLDHRGIGKVRVTRLDGPSGEVGDSWAGTVKIGDTSRFMPVSYASAANPPLRESSLIPSSLGSWFMELVSPLR